MPPWSIAFATVIDFASAPEPELAAVSARVVSSVCQRCRQELSSAFPLSRLQIGLLVLAYGRGAHLASEGTAVVRFGSRERPVSRPGFLQRISGSGWRTLGLTIKPSAS